MKFARRLLPLLVGAAVGCGGAPRVYVCSADAQCRDSGRQGVCQPEGLCSFPDPGCATGQRFVPHAPQPQREACVEDPALRLTWTFDEEEGAAVLDHSGNGFEGSLVGAQRGPGLRGRAVQLDGVDDRAERAGPSLVFYDSSFSGSVWVKTTDLDFSQSRVLGTNLNTPAYVWLNIDTRGYFTLEAKDNLDVSWTTQSNTLVADDGWHHLGFVIDRAAGQVRVFVDGHLRGVNARSSAGTFGDESVTYFFRVGCQPLPTTEFCLRGEVDEVRMYSRALRDLEMRSLYEAHVP